MGTGIGEDGLDSNLLMLCYILVEVEGFTSVSGTELSIAAEEGTGQNLSPVACGMWLKRSGGFRRVRRHNGNVWKPTRRFKTLCEENHIRS